MNTDYQSKYEQIQNFRPIDDTFFEVLIQEPGVCEEMLQILLDDPDLTVIEIHTQKTIKKLLNRGVRLDALCKTGKGELVNIEIQRSNKDNHLKRVRYNASQVTAYSTKPGTKFKDIPTIYSIYISEFDIFGYQYPIYHIDKIIREVKQFVDDGHYIVFANTEIDDHTKASEYLQALKQKWVDQNKFPALGNGIKRLKNDQGGISKMCEIMETYAKEYAEKLINEQLIDKVVHMIQQEFSKEAILNIGFTDEQYVAALQIIENK